MKNYIVIDAQITSKAVRKGKSWRYTASCLRKSGKKDNFNLVTQEELECGEFVNIKGHISISVVKGTTKIKECLVCGDKVVKLSEEPENYENKVVLEGCTLLSGVDFRKSFDDSGKDVATYELCLGDSGRVHATSWESSARFVNNRVKVGDSLKVEGRLQGYISQKSGMLYFSVVTFFIELAD